MSRLGRWIKVPVELLRQYPVAVVTAEALVWHHGYKGLDAALKAAEAPADDPREAVRAELVARPRGGSLSAVQAGGRRRAGVASRPLGLAQGQMIHEPETPAMTPSLQS